MNPQRWTRHASLFVATCSLTLAVAAGTPPVDAKAAPDPAPRPASVAASLLASSTFRVEVPSGPGPFVVHGTVPVVKQTFDRFSCPYTLQTPDGRDMATQWELVARLQDGMVVELRGLCQQNLWSGSQDFRIVEKPYPFHLNDYDVNTVAALVLQDQVQLEIEDQNGVRHTRSLSGYSSSKPIYRVGPVTLTLERSHVDAFGGTQSWLSVDAAREELHLILNWNNGTLPAQPDVHFRSARLNVPAGWTWTPFLPDPACGNGYLIQPDDHVIPQRMERSFRIVIHRQGTTPDLTYRGWAASDWRDGGYFAQSIPLPDLSYATFDLSKQQVLDYDLLENNQPTLPGDVPVSFLWPARGVKYGGMTGGFDIHQFEGVRQVMSGQTEGMLSLFVEQLRYGARHMGCIYEADGRPIAIEDYANPDGSLPWSMFNNVFAGNPPKDSPFEFADTGPGSGVAAYDPLEYEPIDDQHLIRRSKANKALAWLDNDPLAKRYVEMDATLKRMIYYEGTGGRITPPATPDEGVSWGRGEAWAADALVTAYALGDDAWRARHLDWFVQFSLALYRAQMPSGLFSALQTGKVATSPPYGHKLNEPCMFGIHTFDPTSSSEVADFLAHRGNEQVFLILALKGFKETVGIDTGQMIASCGTGLWNLAWKPGTDGLLDRYPVGMVGSPLFSNASQIPAGLTTTIPKDSYHVGTALWAALVEGAPLLGAFYAYSNASDLNQALANLQWRNGNYAENYAPLLALLQSVLP